MLVPIDTEGRVLSYTDAKTLTDDTVHFVGNEPSDLRRVTGTYHVEGASPHRHLMRGSAIAAVEFNEPTIPPLDVEQGDDSGSTPSAPIEQWFETPIAFDDPGLVPQTFAITAVNQGAKKFTIAGDHVAAIGTSLVVSGSTGNDDAYNVVVAVLDTGSTVITVDEAIADATADGDLITCKGVVVYEPSAGDRLLDVQVEILTPWDGTSPKGDVGMFGGEIPEKGWFGALTSGVLDMTFVAEDNYGGIAYSDDQQTSIAEALGGLGYGLIGGRFTGDEAVRCLVSGDGSIGGAAPGASQGSAVVHVKIRLAT